VGKAVPDAARVFALLSSPSRGDASRRSPGFLTAASSRGSACRRRSG